MSTSLPVFRAIFRSFFLNTRKETIEKNVSNKIPTGYDFLLECIARNDRREDTNSTRESVRKRVRKINKSLGKQFALLDYSVSKVLVSELRNRLSVMTEIIQTDDDKYYIYVSRA